MTKTQVELMTRKDLMAALRMGVGRPPPKRKVVVDWEFGVPPPPPTVAYSFLEWMRQMQEAPGVWFRRAYKTAGGTYAHQTDLRAMGFEAKKVELELYGRWPQGKTVPPRAPPGFNDGGFALRGVQRHSMKDWQAAMKRSPNRWAKRTFRTPGSARAMASDLRRDGFEVRRDANHLVARWRTGSLEPALSARNRRARRERARKAARS